MDLRDLNQQLEQGTDLHTFPKANLLQRWLWETDPDEDLHQTVLLNTNHLVGLLYCRFIARTEQQQSTPSLAYDRLKLCDLSPLTMNLQQLLDTLDNICVEWPIFLRSSSSTNVAPYSVVQYVHGCARRFAILASYEFDSSVLNCAQYTEEGESPGKCKMTFTGIRRFLNLLVILFRHFFLLANAQVVPAEPFATHIRRPHMEASMEAFDVLCMHFQIPVGARLRYKNEFRGMYNHISQVMYFHNPQYERIPRIAWDQVDACTDSYQVLPALLELHPEIKVYYEEDHFFHEPVLPHWAWLLVAGRIYLISPDKDIYFSDNITALFKIFKTTTSP